LLRLHLAFRRCVDRCWGRPPSIGRMHLLRTRCRIFLPLYTCHIGGQNCVLQRFLYRWVCKIIDRLRRSSFVLCGIRCVRGARLP
jgi:hypothetical protein